MSSKTVTALSSPTRLQRSHVRRRAHPQGQRSRWSGRTFDVGTLAQITGYARLPDGRYLLEVEGTNAVPDRRDGRQRLVSDGAVSWLPEADRQLRRRARCVGRCRRGSSTSYRFAAATATCPCICRPIRSRARTCRVAAADRPAGEATTARARHGGGRLGAEGEILRREFALARPPAGCGASPLQHVLDLLARARRLDLAVVHERQLAVGCRRTASRVGRGSVSSA